MKSSRIYLKIVKKKKRRKFSVIFKEIQLFWKLNAKSKTTSNRFSQLLADGNGMCLDDVGYIGINGRRKRDLGI